MSFPISSESDGQEGSIEQGEPDGNGVDIRESDPATDESRRDEWTDEVTQAVKCMHEAEFLVRLRQRRDIYIEEAKWHTESNACKYEWYRQLYLLWSCPQAGQQGEAPTDEDVGRGNDRERRDTADGNVRDERAERSPDDHLMRKAVSL